jgi:DNA-binding transcriptional LysR family regulator
VSTIEQLPDWPIARLAGSFPCENLLTKSLSSHVRQRYVICNNFMAMRTMVVSGNCVGVLPDLLLEDAIELKQVRRLAGAAVFPDAEMFISWAGTQSSKPVANFVSSLETISTFKRRNLQPALAEVRFG